MTGFWDAAAAYLNSDRAVFDFGEFLLCYGLILIGVSLDTAFPPKG